MSAFLDVRFGATLGAAPQAVAVPGAAGSEERVQRSDLPAREWKRGDGVRVLIGRRDERAASRVFERDDDGLLLVQSVALAQALGAATILLAIDTADPKAPEVIDLSAQNALRKVLKEHFANADNAIAIATEAGLIQRTPSEIVWAAFGARAI